MTSLVTLKSQILRDPDHWQIPFMDFVDEFRREKSPAQIELGFIPTHERFDALLASTVEYLCHEQHIKIPAWVAAIPACRKPWFVAGIESIKAIALVESPVEFRIRKIFVLENFLTRI